MQGTILLLAIAQIFDPDQNVAPANLTPPAAGQTFVDTAFGVTVRRLTDRSNSGGLATAEYPQLQAVNADETRILISTNDGYEIMEIGSWQITHRALAMSLPRWSPVDADTLWHFNRRSGTIILQKTVLTGNGTSETTNVVNLASLGFTSLEYGSWEDFSEDGRYVGLHGTRNGRLVAAVLDVNTGEITAEVGITEADWIAVSPSGRYFVVQYLPRGTGPTDGLVVYDRATGDRLGHLTDHHEHGDLGRDHLGREVFVTIAYTDFCANGAVPCYSVAPLPDSHESGMRRDLGTPEYGNYTSCRNLRRGGFCLHSDDSTAGGVAPLSGEIWLVRHSDGGVMRLAHHRSSACSYYNYTRPTLSPTGRYALFTSDWGNPNCNDSGDLYLIDLEPMVSDWLGTTPPPPIDAGILDGAPIDVGFDDAGDPIAIDAGKDSGSIEGTDAGDAGGSDRQGRTTGGCGCNASRREDGLAVGLLLFFALVLARRSFGSGGTNHVTRPGVRL